MTAKSNEHISVFVQASHYIIEQLQKAKENTELILDRFVEILWVTDRDGVLLKTNESGARYLGSTPEDTLGLSIRDVFEREAANIFLAKLHGIERHSRVLFETNFVSPVHGKRKLLWSCSHLPIAAEHGDTFVTIGYDITELREFEAETSRLFQTIPIGLLQVDADLRITTPYSQYCHHLLATPNLAGHRLDEVLFGHCHSDLEESEKAALQHLPFAMGGSNVQFSILRTELPTRIHTPAGKWLEVSYEPVMEDGLVAGLFIVLTDRTEHEVRLLDDLDKARREALAAERFVALQRLNPTIRNSVIIDVRNSLERVKVEVNSGNSSPQLLLDLHTAKGAARIGGIRLLAQAIHEAETALGVAIMQGEPINNLLDAVFTEWNAVQRVQQGIIAMENWSEDVAPHSETAQPLFALADLTDHLELVVRQTAGELQRHVDFQIANQPASIPSAYRGMLRECMAHLLTNAVDHGFAGKPQGRIRVEQEHQDKEIIRIVLDDDGVGINLAAVKSAAINRKVLTPTEAESMDDAALRNVIFAESFSTRTEANTISGRGLGLASVRRALEAVGGHILAMESPMGGSRFIIELPLTL